MIDSNKQTRCLRCGRAIPEDMLPLAIKDEPLGGYLCGYRCYIDLTRFREKKSTAIRVKIRKEKEHKTPIPEINGSTSCEILLNHHNILEGDKERLSTDFMKSLIFGKKDKCPDVF